MSEGRTAVEKEREKAGDREGCGGEKEGLSIAGSQKNKLI